MMQQIQEKQNHPTLVPEAGASSLSCSESSQAALQALSLLSWPSLYIPKQHETLPSPRMKGQENPEPTSAVGTGPCLLLP